MSKIYTKLLIKLYCPLSSRKDSEDIYSRSLSSIDLGLRQPRLEGEEYLSIVDEFMEAVFTRWPKAIVQVYFFEKNGFHLCLVSICLVT